MQQLVSVLEAEHARQAQIGDLVSAAQIAMAITADFGNEISQAHVTGDNQAFGPGRCVHVLLWEQADTLGINPQCLPSADPLKCTGGMEGDTTLVDADPRAVCILAHHKTPVEAFQQGVAGLHQQGASRRIGGVIGAAQQHLTALETNQALLAVKSQVSSTIGVQVQHRAIGQREATVLTGSTGKV
ncbi:hypothetical protein D3C77_402280 [compost metagenome]